MSYGAAYADIWGRAACLVGRLPKALGVSIPQSILPRADEVAR